ncbi:MAG TPA: LptA/OstA family protein [Dongiaceae bacterium]|nr:LptA/OstA family protein [Dongiaceae bacterium]
MAFLRPAGGAALLYGLGAMLAMSAGGAAFAQSTGNAASTAPSSTAPTATAPAATAPASNGGDSGGGFDISGNKPIDISADNGIEWRKQDKIYIARGKALAVQGDQSIAGDTLTGFYSTDSNHIDRMTAEGNVVIKSPSQTAYGDHADYDTNTKLLVMTGNNLKSVTDKGDVVTARDRMEYWKDRDTVVAKGNVYTVHGDTKVHSDLANGYFHIDSTGKKVLYQLEAIGNVRTDTAKETAWSDKMVYNLETKIAVLMGHVRILQGNNTFTGDRAEINTDTNVSRLLSDPGKTGTRVHTTIGPKSNNNSTNSSNKPATSNGGNATGGASGSGTTTQP